MKEDFLVWFSPMHSLSYETIEAVPVISFFVVHSLSLAQFLCGTLQGEIRFSVGMDTLCSLEAACTWTEGMKKWSNGIFLN